MSNRVCVFVDGENLRHSIVDLFHGFDRKDYLPKKADWAEFFDWLVEQAAPDGERVRTYWYVVENLDYFPYSFPDADEEPDRLRRLLCKDANTRRGLELLEGEALTVKMKETVERLEAQRNFMKSRFDGWSVIHNGIAARHPALEFRPAGAIRYNLFDGSLGAEKVVDVKLAIDMLMLRDIYDVAVIVSGDQDYVPAVKAVKDFGKRIVNVAFRTRSDKLLPNGAWRLNIATDWSLEVPYDDFEKHLNI